MELVIKNEVLQKLLSVATKCSNPNIPLGSMLGLKFDNGELEVRTTDGTSYMLLKSSDVVSGDNGFNVTVKIEGFVDKINKLLSTLESKLVLDGYKLQLLCGKYSTMIELPLDAEGKLVNYTDKFNGFKAVDSIVIKEDDLKTTVSALKGSLPKDITLGAEYMNYLFSDEVISTDSEAISIFKKKLLSTDGLMSPKILDLILLGDGDVTVETADDKMMLSNSNISLFTSVIGGIENYNKSLLEPFINKKYPSFCEVDLSGENGLKYALELLLLDVGNFDRAINLSFNTFEVALESSDKRTNFNVAYTNSNVDDTLNAKINIDLLKNQLAAVRGSKVKILFGDDKSICLDCGDVLHILSLS